MPGKMVWIYLEKNLNINSKNNNPYKIALRRKRIIMTDCVWADKLEIPDNKKLAKILGPAYKYWQELKNYLEKNWGPVIEEWKFYGQKSGWILKTLRKNRNLFFLVPMNNYFKITFVFGDKAVEAVEKSDLPKEIKNTLKNARKYMEGRTIQIEVKLPADIENIKKLLEIKINN